MIHNVIKIIKENILNNNISELYNDYTNKKRLEEEIKELRKQIEDLELNLEQLKGELQSFNFLKKIPDRDNYKKIKDDISELESKITLLKNQVENLNNSCNKINFNTDELERINEYVTALNLENSLQTGKNDELIANLIEFFDFDFKNLLTFARKTI